MVELCKRIRHSNQISKTNFRADIIMLIGTVICWWTGLLSLITCYLLSGYDPRNSVHAWALQESEIRQRKADGSDLNPPSSKLGLLLVEIMSSCLWHACSLNHWCLKDSKDHHSLTLLHQLLVDLWKLKAELLNMFSGITRRGWTKQRGAKYFQVEMDLMAEQHEGASGYNSKQVRTNLFVRNL